MSLNREGPVKAIRKVATCDGCGKRLEIGEPAVRWVGLSDGEFGTAVFHPECRAVEIELNKLAGNGWYDDWIGLRDHEPDDEPWLLAEHPIVAARLGLSPIPATVAADRGGRDGA